MFWKRIAALSALAALSCLLAPFAQAASEGGITVTSDKSGTETVLGTDVKLTPLPATGRIKVNDLLHYDFEDMIDLNTGKAKDALDPNANAKAVQLEGSNWYAAPSLTKLLQRFYVPRKTARTDDNRDSLGPLEEGTIAEPIDEPDYEPVDEAEEAPITSTYPSAKAHSTTNTQVEGVDESDIIKTDGDTLFYLHPSKGIAVFDVRTGTPKQIGMLKPNARIGEELPTYQDLYISGKNLVIVSRKTNVNIYEGVKANQSNLPMSMYRRNDASFTGIDIYDIANPKQIVLKRQINIQGDSLTNRLYNNTLYLLASQTMSAYDQSPLIDILPKYQDSALGSEFYVMSPKDIYLSVYSDTRWIQFVALAAVDLSSDDKPLQLSTYETGSGNELYMSKNAIYLTLPKRLRGKYDAKIESGMRDCFPIGAKETNSHTTIARFDTKQGGYSFAAMAKVSGQIQDKFSLDESKGTLRVLSNRYFAKTGNQIDLTVFDAKTLKQAGHLDAIARDTYLDSVRFRGDTAYVATTGGFDPLLVLDLASASSPKKAGTLDLKGFTGYLHPFQDKYLIGMGYCIENTYVKNKEQKDKHVGYRTGGVQFTMYDVSNPQKPAKIHELVIGGPNTTTIGMSNPKTIMFDASRGTMTMPFYYEDSEIKTGDRDATVTSWRGGLVVEVTPQGFKEGARFELQDYYANSNDSRFAYVGDTLYYVTQNALVALNYDSYKIKSALTIVY